jgi:hypothetical protein
MRSRGAARAAIAHLRALNHPPNTEGARGWPRFQQLAPAVLQGVPDAELRAAYAAVASRCFGQTARVDLPPTYRGFLGHTGPAAG